MNGRAKVFQRIRFYVNRDALQRSWVRVLKIFIQNWALLAHIHLHILGASFTKLRQGPYFVEKPEFLRHALISIGPTYYIDEAKGFLVTLYRLYSLNFFR